MKRLSDVELSRALFKALRNEPKFDTFRDYIEKLRKDNPEGHKTSSGFSFCRKEKES